MRTNQRNRGRLKVNINKMASVHPTEAPAWASCPERVLTVSYTPMPATKKKSTIRIIPRQLYVALSKKGDFSNLCASCTLLRGRRSERQPQPALIVAQRLSSVHGSRRNLPQDISAMTQRPITSFFKQQKEVGAPYHIDQHLF